MALEATVLSADARQAWNDHPHLAYAFCDFADFRRAFAVATGRQAGSSSALSSRVASLECFEREWTSVGASRLSLMRGVEQTAQAHLFDRRGERLVLWLYGPVMLTGACAGSITADAVCAALEAHHSAEAVILRIDSPGGMGSAAKAIFLALQKHRGRKIAIIDRHCFSAANFFIAAADRVVMRRSATLMHHHALLSAYGDAQALLRASYEVRAVDDFLDRAIATARGVPVSALRAISVAGSYHSSEEARALGLVDAVTDDLNPHLAGGRHGAGASATTSRRGFAMDLETSKQSAIAIGPISIERLAAAEAAVEKAEARLSEVDTALAANLEEIQQLRDGQVACAAEDCAFSETEKKARALSDKLIRAMGWNTQLEALRTQKSADIIAAQIELSREERTLIGDQAEYFKREFSQRLQDLAGQIAKPLCALAEMAYAADFLGLAAEGRDGISRVAQRDFASVIGHDLTDAVAAAVSALRGAGEDLSVASFLTDAPSTEPLKSARLEPRVRGLITSLERSGKEVTVPELSSARAFSLAVDGKNFTDRAGKLPTLQWFSQTLASAEASLRNASIDLDNRRRFRTANDAKWIEDGVARFAACETRLVEARRQLEHASTTGSHRPETA